MNKGRCRHTICPEAKQEVAREIFEEIDMQLAFLKRYGNVSKTTDLIFNIIAELKKKYIKDCTTCGHMVSCEPNPFGICDEYMEGNNG